MKITMSGNYKSLSDFESCQLNNFVVITGKNGSGKTQLLECMALNKVVIEPIVTKSVMFSLHAQPMKAINREEWRKQISVYASELNNWSSETRRLLKKIYELELLGNEGVIKITDHLNGIFADATQVNSNVTKVMKELSGNLNNQFNQNNNEDISKILKSKFRHIKLYCYVSDYRKKNIEDINENDIYLGSFPEEYFDSNDIMSSELSKIFYQYALKRDQNSRHYFEKKEYGDENGSISRDEFNKIYPPPWEIINSILGRHEIDFEFCGIEQSEFSQDIPIKFTLNKKSVAAPVELNDLSSGEKNIIGLIVKLFICEFYGEEMAFPELIYLDEPDAYLHPEMSRLLVEVLNETFVKRFGIKVIMTTHSPSTIALCPEESIYELKNTPKTTLQKVNKDDALSILLGSIPNLSIDYKNHKQVFLESPTDVKYFQILHDKMIESGKYNSRLYFISYAMGKGNCQQVINTVTEMREAGNKTVFGIIDWDNKNKDSKYVKVHGIDKRYSIENFVYDPIYLCVLFMAKNNHGVLGVAKKTSAFNQYSIGNEPNKILQELIDWFFEEIYKSKPTLRPSEDDRQITYYHNGKELLIPGWYLKQRGHDLEIKLKEVFKSLTAFPKEGGLQNELSVIIGKCYPFVPSESVTLIESVINA
jgi:AAA15 family ATPase/GTPase